MFCGLKRTVPSCQFFRTPKTQVLIESKQNNCELLSSGSVGTKNRDNISLVKIDRSITFNHYFRFCKMFCFPFLFCVLRPFRYKEDQVSSFFMLRHMFPLLHQNAKLKLQNLGIQQCGMKAPEHF